jgi:hypothetical protein
MRGARKLRSLDGDADVQLMLLIGSIIILLLPQ